MTTRQNQFDTALAHLRQQGQRAIAPGRAGCEYRTPNGLKCAVGALIPDEKYNEHMEGRPASCEMVLRALGATAHDSHFLDRLQSTLHDTIIEEDFRGELEIRAREFAEDFELEYVPCPAS